METVEAFLREYGYIVLLVGTFLEGETMVLVAGYMAKVGLLDLNLVILSSFCGTYCGDQLYYFIGRRWGNSAIKRTNENWQRRSARVMDLLQRYDTWFILGFRFVYGVRNVTPFVLGATSIRPLRFMILNALAAIVWAISFAYGGYIFGHAMEAFLEQIKSYQMTFFAGLGVVLIGIWFYRRFKSRRSTDQVS
ncbi:MAG: DedA family protein [Magnetococcales bacterium]|nr:DedA family protein [Magnetococcales bacterium]MBF0439080.1 DedA family protein [Magnetococcales bacterium]